MKKRKIITKTLSLLLAAVMVIGTIAAVAACKKEELTLYSIKYELDGGERPEDAPTKFTSEDLPLTIGQATKPNFTFLGWTSEINEDKRFTVEIPKGTSENLTFTAHWAESQFILSYNLSEGVNAASNPAKYSEKDLPLEISPATKPGFVFTGWTSELNSVEQITAVIPRATYRNLTFTAHFEEDEVGKFVISYQLNNGTNHEENPSKYYDFSLPLTIKEPTKDDYVFLGWTSELNDEPQQTVEIPQGTEQHLIFVAHWRANVHNITYRLDGGKHNAQNPYTYTADDLPLRILPITKANVAGFLGWTSEINDEPIIEFDIPVGTKINLTLSAHWDAEAVTYKNGKKKAPDFTLTDMNGKSVSLSDYYGKKPVFITFWAYWCSPCLSEMSGIFNPLYADRSDDFELLACHIDSLDGLKDLLKSRSFLFPILDDSSYKAFAKGYSTGFYPANYIVDRWGYLYNANYSGTSTNQYDFGTIANRSVMEKAIDEAIARAK